MQTVKIGGRKVIYHDDPAEMPIKRFHLFNKYALIDAGLGSDINGIDAALANLYKFMSSDMKEEARQQALNIRQGLYMVMSQTSAKHLSFAVLVESVDGVKVEHTEAGLERTLAKLANAKTSVLERALESVKKNFKLFCASITRSNSRAGRPKRRTTN